MSLSSALQVANSALMNSAAQADIVARNISNVDRPNYARRSALTTTNAEGGVLTMSVDRATDRALSSARLIAASDSAAARAVRDAMMQLAQVGGLGSSAAMATMISDLGAAMDSLADAPGDAALQNAAVEAARNVVQSLNEATKATQKLRAQADAEMAAAVDDVNDLLKKFKETNDDIVKGTTRGAEVSDALDRRDGILADLAAKIGIHTLERENGDIAIFTDTGVTLFDKSARAVTFTPTPTFDARTKGATVQVDGVPLGSGKNLNAALSGELVGLMRVRDEFAPVYQTQLDEAARTLALAFVEHDPSGANADAMGLFTAPGMTSPPALGAAKGFAGLITIAASVDPSQGGNPALLRDGGIAGTAYKLNNLGAAGFADRLIELSEALGAARTFDAAAQVGGTATLESFAASSIGWIEAGRKSADQAASYRDAVLTNISSSLSNATGVNLDDEMSKMMAIENSYNATAKLISTVDSMFQSLLQAVG